MTSGNKYDLICLARVISVCEISVFGVNDPKKIAVGDKWVSVTSIDHRKRRPGQFLSAGLLDIMWT